MRFIYTMNKSLVLNLEGIRWNQLSNGHLILNNFTSVSAYDANARSINIKRAARARISCQCKVPQKGRTTLHLINMINKIFLTKKYIYLTQEKKWENAISGLMHIVTKLFCKGLDKNITTFHTRIIAGAESSSWLCLLVHIKHMNSSMKFDKSTTCTTFAYYTPNFFLL